MRSSVLPSPRQSLSLSSDDWLVVGLGILSSLAQKLEVRGSWCAIELGLRCSFSEKLEERG